MHSVLVVDDNPDVHATVALLLRANGYKTFVASNGVDAVSTVQSQCPSVVLLDLSMPKMSGVNACKAIRQMNLDQQPVIIAMTGYGSERDVEFCLENGFDAHSLKGQEFPKLQAIIERCLAEKFVT